MAKYSYTDNNGITFSNLDSNPSPKKSIDGKLFFGQNDFSHTEWGIDPVVNAVEIDWNGAQVQLNGDSLDRTINTTGDLINAIYVAYNNMINYNL